MTKELKRQVFTTLVVGCGCCTALGMAGYMQPGRPMRPKVGQVPAVEEDGQGTQAGEVTS